MFDLEQSIAAWRQQMWTGGIQTDALLDELESHLREDVARQIHSGVAAEQAFASALRQLGSADALQVEFGKVSLFTPAQIRKGCVIAYCLELAAYTVLQFRFLWKAGPSHQDLLLGGIGLAATLGAAYGVWRLAPIVMRPVANKLLRSLIVVASCVSGMIWLLVFVWFILPHLELTPGQFAVVLLWALLPQMALPPTVAGLDQRPSHQR